MTGDDDGRVYAVDARRLLPGRRRRGHGDPGRRRGTGRDRLHRDRPARRRQAGARQRRRRGVHLELRHRGRRAAEDLRTGGCPCHTRQYGRGAGPRPDVGDHPLEPSGTDAEHALRAGEGATTMAADPAGRVLVADTRGDELLVFGTDPLILRQRYPVPDAPYGLAGSSTTGLGVADCDEHRGWLRSGNRNPRREGALSNRAAAELPGLRRMRRAPCMWCPARELVCR